MNTRINFIFRVANFQKMKFGTRRRRVRDTVGVEVVENGDGYPSPQPTRRSGERRELPQHGPPKTNLGHIKRRRKPVVEGKSGTS